MRSVSVKLMADAADFNRAIRGASLSVKGLAGDLDKANKAGNLDHVTDMAAGLGLGLAGAAAVVVKFSMDFEKSMSAVSAATHASANDLDQLRKAAIQAGKDTQYSATEAANGITELSKAGVSAAQILGGGLDGALSLAAAGQLDVAEAAETAASAMTQFKLKGDAVPHIADLLAAGAGKAQGSVHDLGQALNQGGLVASQFNLSIEDTTGVLAEFANAGLIGSDAGTSFKTMLLAIANPSGVTAKKMQELGISFYNSKGQFIGLSGVADELRDKLGQLTEEQRNAALGQIFGSDAIRAATVLYKDGSKGVEEWKNKVNDSGYAAETAAKLTDNLAGDIERLKGSLETMAIEAGGGANDGLRVLTKGANALVDTVGALPPAFTGTLTVMAGVGGAALLLGAGWFKLKRQTADMLQELRDAGPAGTRAAGGLQRAAGAAGKAAAAFAVLEIADAAISATMSDLNPQVEALSSGLASFSYSGEASGEMARLLGDDLGKLTGKFQTLADTNNARYNAARAIGESFEGMSSSLAKADDSLTTTKERITAVDGELGKMVANGHADTAKAAFDQLAKKLAINGVSMEEFRAQFPAYAAALEVAGSATKDTAGDIDELGNAAGSSQGQVMALSKSMDDLFQTQISADRAALKLADSTNALTKELLDGKRTLSLNSEEGRKNRAAILDNLDAIEANRDARVRGGETLDEANKKYLKDIEGLKKSATQAGFSKKAVNQLTSAYEGIPGQVNTKISTTGEPKVQSLLDDLLIKQQALKKGISLSSAASAFRKNAGYHDGGRTPMVGEHEPAGVVHGKEFVFSAATVRRIDAQAPGFLDEAQATGQLPGYAGGGRVATWPFPMTVAKTMIPKPPAFTGDFGHWPSSPSAQRGDSGVWRQVVALIKSTGPLSGSFGNAYRPGDPLWHGSGRAVDWMGYNQDALATFLAGRRPLELIHRTKNRDYAYTRGVNKGSFNESLMEAHRNHVHIAMKDGGVIDEPIFGVGASGKTYSFGEDYVPERVIPNWQGGNQGGSGGGGGGTTNIYLTAQLAAGANPREAGRQIAESLQTYLVGGGTIYVRGQKVLGG